MRHLTCPPTAEVSGQTMLSFAENVRAEDIQPTLEKHGLTPIQPEKWYPLQTWLDVLNDMSESSDFTSNLVAIGIAIMDKIPLPPEAAEWTLPYVLSIWDSLYQAQHRGADVGHVSTEKISETHYKTTHVHVYPDDMTYGVGYGMARRFMRGGHVRVAYDENEPRLDEGGTKTIIHFHW